jgi:hypothetical protein
MITYTSALHACWHVAALHKVSSSDTVYLLSVECVTVATELVKCAHYHQAHLISCCTSVCTHLTVSMTTASMYPQ